MEYGTWSLKVLNVTKFIVNWSRGNSDSLKIIRDPLFYKAIKFIYSEKATKIWQNLQTCLNAATKIQIKIGDFIKFISFIRIYELYMIETFGSTGFCTGLNYAPSEMISTHYESISRILINFQARAESRYPITDVHRSG